MMRDAGWRRRDVGWFGYGRFREGRVGNWKITRVPEDPPIVIYHTGDGGWIVDDAPRERHTILNGLTEDEIRTALTFGLAVGWIEGGTRISFRAAQLWTDTSAERVDEATAE
jgi:hypothetical protein